jgi:hypothetical protein
MKTFKLPEPLRAFWEWLLYGPEEGGLAPSPEQMRRKGMLPTSKVRRPAGNVRYLVRPRDGVQFGPLPDLRDEHAMFLNGHDDDGPLWVAVCDTCAGNCGQCGTSIGMGIPFDFDYMIEKNNWDKPGWGFKR